MNNRVLVVGSGNMAIEYVKVLRDLNIEFDVVGRSEAGAARFLDQTGVAAVPGGIDRFIDTNGLAAYSHCIVATNVCQLYGNTMALLNAGATSLLVEKPCVLDEQELESLNERVQSKAANVFIAYNRRFFSSVVRAKEIIAEDGGLNLVKFDFTEWAHVIGGLDKDPREKQRWLLANSTHIIDLAFHFSGVPTELSTYTSGSLDWHPASQTFSGAGRSETGTIISYGSDWGSASRWWLELFTPKRKLRLCPVETLTETLKGTVKEAPVELSNELDLEYKPGLYSQLRAFLEGDDTCLASSEDLAKSFPWYLKIAGYN